MDSKVYLGTAGFISQEKKVLLVRRDPSEGFLAGYYEMPGGSIEHGEDPYIGVEREVLEEANLKVKALRPYHTWVDPFPGGDKQYYEIDFIMELQETTSNLRLSSEHNDYKWVKETDLLDYKISPKMLEAIQLGFKELEK